MAAQPVMTAEELIERVRHAGPPTPDEVTSGWLRSRRSAQRKPPPRVPTPDGPPHDLGRLIEVLDRHEVEYLMVGGVAAIGYGAERPTEDADCVVRRERANLDRLAGALRELHARLRVGGMTDADAQALPVQIDATTLDLAGMSTWMTDAGPFDVLAGLETTDGRLVPYEELVVRATLLYGDGFTIKAASLEDIIRAKERADRTKDREALPELRALRDASASEDTPPS